MRFNKLQTKKFPARLRTNEFILRDTLKTHSIRGLLYCSLCINQLLPFVKSLNKKLALSNTKFLFSLACASLNKPLENECTEYYVDLHVYFYIEV